MSIYDFISKDIKENSVNNIASITVGVVTDISDPEKLGRVKVKLINRTTSNYETDFIRVMTSMSGKEWGTFFFPEVGDEVLVAFCDGDITRPYVLGSLWNDSRKQPVKLSDGKNDIRKVKTKSGHEIIFDDTDGKERVDLITSGKLQISLDDKANTIKVTDEHGENQLIINSKEGSISIKASKKIELSAKGVKLTLDGSGSSVSLESPGSIKIDGSQLNLKGKSTAEMSSSGQVTVSSSGITNVKGSIVKIN